MPEKILTQNSCGGAISVDSCSPMLKQTLSPTFESQLGRSTGLSRGITLESSVLRLIRGGT